MQLTEPEKQFIQATLQQYVPDCEVWVFGSRALNKAQPYSDLDVLLKCHTKIPLAILEQLAEAFADSDLSFKVDLVDWHRISLEFREHIKSQCIAL